MSRIDVVNIDTFFSQILAKEPEAPFSHPINVPDWSTADIYEELLNFYAAIIRKKKRCTIVAIDELELDDLEYVSRYMASIGVRLHFQVDHLEIDQEYVNTNQEYLDHAYEPGYPLEECKFRMYSPISRAVLTIWFSKHPSALDDCPVDDCHVDGGDVGGGSI
jgi:hypothetical protein